MAALFVSLSLSVHAAQAQDATPRVVPKTVQQMQLSFAPVVADVAPSVVNIYAKRLVRERVVLNPFFNDPVLQQLLGSRGGARERMERTLGSGVIIDEKGTIVTNNHVVENTQDIVVVMNDGREFEAEVALTDAQSDLAVLRLTETADAPFKPIVIADSDEVKAGDIVLAIGNPFGVGQTVTSGIVSATARTAVGIGNIDFFIQTDAAVNPGNSGGALVNMHGELVGINTAIFSRDGGSLGISFAVPSNMVNTILRSIQSGAGSVVRPWAGLTAQRMTSDIASTLGLKRNFGVLVKSLHPASPLVAAGVKPGDVITAINGREVPDPQSLHYRLASMSVGEKITLQIYRQQRTFDVAFTGTPAPETPARDEWVVDDRSPFAGVTVANISPALQEAFDGISRENGVAIIAIKPESLMASRMGVMVGDVILSINGTEISSVSALKTLLARSSKGWQIQIQRDSRVLTIRISG